MERKETNLDLRIMGNGRLAILGGNDNLENTKIVLLHGVGCSIPVVYPQCKYGSFDAMCPNRLDSLNSPIREAL